MMRVGTKAERVSCDGRRGHILSILSDEVSLVLQSEKHPLKTWKLDFSTLRRGPDMERSEGQVQCLC